MSFSRSTATWMTRLFSRRNPTPRIASSSCLGPSRYLSAMQAIILMSPAGARPHEQQRCLLHGAQHKQQRKAAWVTVLPPVRRTTPTSLSWTIWLWVKNLPPAWKNHRNLCITKPHEWQGCFLPCILVCNTIYLVRYTLNNILPAKVWSPMQWIIYHRSDWDSTHST